MSMKSCKLYPLSIVALGMLLGITLVNPICYAGGAVTQVPAKDRGLPEGSHIPDHRIKKIQKKVKALKAKMKEKE